MLNRLLIATCLTGLLSLGWASNLSAHGPAKVPIRSIFTFGDSLIDTGNLFAISGGFEPPSPPYFDGRFSDGPLWIEYLAEQLRIEIDFDTPVTLDPLANNQAVGGAFTDSRNANELPIPTAADTGILSQVADFAMAGGRFRPTDVVVVWGGANNYLFDPFPDPALIVDDIVRAVEDLAELRARRFVVPNLPNLGDTPFGALVLVDPVLIQGLNSLVQDHNARLAEAMEELREDLQLEIVTLDINAAFQDVLLDPGAVVFTT